MENAERIKNLPPYLFAEIDRMIDQAREEGVDVISFGIGDPDQPTPDNIVEEMIRAVQDPATHSYPSYEGLPEFRRAAADWYRDRYDVDFDPETEVVSLIGSKEGLAHLPFCFINPGDKALVPDPAYPVYKTSVLLAGGEVEIMPLTRENSFLPDLKAIDQKLAAEAKLIYINYPNNPTGAIADGDFYRRVIDFAHRYQLIVAHDAAYSEIGLDGYRPPSFLEFEGARQVGVEFNSLSKPFNMTGWRIGFALGNSEVIEALGRIKTNIDSGIFEAIQYAGIEALHNPGNNIDRMREIYRQRRDLLVSGLRELGWTVEPNQASFYLWIPVPDNRSSREFSRDVFKKTGVFLTPGEGYGDYGKGYLRLALTVSRARIKEALARLQEHNLEF